MGLTGVSNHLAAVAEFIHRAAQTDANVFIRGENGCGKELVAKAIHRLSRRAHENYVPVNCASIADTLIERELFGHEKGAFTGANASSLGYFQSANRGTIFLDEIGDMKPNLQTALLRVLEERKVTPVGSTVAKDVDVRVIAATNAPIETKIAQGTFREDLFHRLNVLMITVIPLRERPEDIPLLAQAFIDRANHDYSMNKILTPAVVDELKTYSWPGNVRQLKNTIERMVIMSSGRTLDTRLLTQQSPDATVNNTKPVAYDAMQFNTYQNEDRLIRYSLEQSGYVISKAARLSRMSRSTFCDKMKQHKIDISKLKPSEGA